MSTIDLRLSARLGAAVLGASLAPWSPLHAQSGFKETQSADPQGSVEIVAITGGSIELDGWDRPEVEVTGPSQADAERVRISRSGGGKTTVHVAPYGGGGEELRLVIHVPAGSSVMTDLVNANLKVGGLKGDAQLRLLNGSVRGDVEGDLQVNSVTGNVSMSTPAARRVEVKTISGDIQLRGGSGEADVSTVSGKVQTDWGTLTRARFKSISGEMSAKFSLAPDAQLEAESVSGTIRFTFASVPNAALDVESFSGDIDNCFGPKPTQTQYGPGSRLVFKSGDGSGRVRIATKSSDIHLCTASQR